MNTLKDSKRKCFCVVQFIEAPHAAIEDYVCVPTNWVTLRHKENQKAIAAYPKDENPSVTRNRAKRREKIKYNNEHWRYYMAMIKYETNTFKDAENWIASRKKGGDVEEEVISIPDVVPARNLRSVTNSSPSRLKEDKPQSTVECHKIQRKPFPRITIRMPRSPFLLKNNRCGDLNNVVNVIKFKKASGCSNQDRSVISNKNRLIRSPRTNISNVIAYKETSSKHNTSSESSTKNLSVDMPVSSPPPKSVDENQGSSLYQDDHVNSTSAIVLYERDEDIENNLDFHPEPDTTDVAPQKNEHSVEFNPEQECQSESYNVEPISLSYQPPQDPPMQIVPTIATTRAPHSEKTQFQGTFMTAISEIRSHEIAGMPSDQYENMPLPLLRVSSALCPKNQPQERPELLSPISQSFTSGAISSTYQEPSLKKPEPFKPTARRNDTSNNTYMTFVDKRTRVENIAGNILNNNMQCPSSSLMLPTLTGGSIKAQSSVAQNDSQPTLQASNAQCNVERGNNDQKIPPQGIGSTLAAWNLSNLPYQSHLLFEPSQAQQFLQARDIHLQTKSWPNQSQNIEQRAYFHNVMTSRGFDLQTQLNSFSQPFQYLPRQGNRYVPVNRYYVQEEIRHEPHTQNVGVGIQFVPQNSSNGSTQPHNMILEHLESNQNDQTPAMQTELNMNRKYDFLIPESQNATNFIPSFAMCSNSVQSVPNYPNGYLSQDSLHLAPVPELVMIQQPIATTRNSETQTETSPSQTFETRSISTYKNIYRHPRSKKMVVDQTTQTDFIMDVDYYEDETDELSEVDNIPKLIENACQTDDYVMEKEMASYQKVDFNCENIVCSQTESDNEICIDGCDNDVIDNDNHLGECIPTEINKNEKLSAGQGLTLDNQQMDVRMAAEHKILNEFGAVLTSLNENLIDTQDMQKVLRNSRLVCSPIYEIVLEKMKQFKEEENPKIVVSSRNNEMLQLIDGKQTEQSENENSGINSGTDVTSKMKNNRCIKTTFVLPPEYDPEDTRWTLKYRSFKPGLVELMPKTGVYVSRSGLKNCKRLSNECRSLARMLLTEIFSKEALAVCSMTGAKARAFKPLDIDVRPGLDDHARMVLLAFVEDYGSKHGWKTYDTFGITSSIRTKILDMRSKFGKMRRA